MEIQLAHYLAHSTVSKHEFYYYVGTLIITRNLFQYFLNLKFSFSLLLTGTCRQTDWPGPK